MITMLWQSTFKSATTTVPTHPQCIYFTFLAIFIFVHKTSFSLKCMICKAECSIRVSRSSKFTQGFCIQNSSYNEDKTNYGIISHVNIIIYINTQFVIQKFIPKIIWYAPFMF